MHMCMHMHMHMCMHMHMHMYMYYLRPVEDFQSHLRYQVLSFWASETLKIVIPENYPQKRSFRLADYHPCMGC